MSEPRNEFAPSSPMELESRYKEEREVFNPRA